MFRSGSIFFEVLSYFPYSNVTHLLHKNIKEILFIKLKVHVVRQNGEIIVHFVLKAPKLAQ